MKFTLSTSLLALSSLPQILALPASAAVVADACVPLSATFQLNVPHSSSALPLLINYAGYTWTIPAAAENGTLVSFFGNFRNNETTSSQITTVTHSTQVANGTSMSSAMGMANGTTVVSTTFASGNASR